MNRKSNIVMQNLFIFCFSFSLWLVFSGMFKPLLLLLGLMSSIIVTLVTNKMFKLIQHDYIYLFNIRAIKYFIWLVKEMIISSIRIIIAIVGPKNPNLKPTLFKISANLENINSLSLYANSITYTPGTFSVIVRDKYIIVHALTLNARQALLSGEMHNKIAKLSS